MRQICAALTLALLAGCGSTPPPSGVGSGPFTTTSIAGEVPGWSGGGWVHAHNSFMPCDSGYYGEPDCPIDEVLISAPVADDGSFEMDLPAGPGFTTEWACAPEGVRVASFANFFATRNETPTMQGDVVTRFILASDTSTQGWIFSDAALEVTEPCEGQDAEWEIDVRLVPGWNIVRTVDDTRGESGPVEGATWRVLER